VTPQPEDRSAVDYPRYDPQSPVTPLTALELDALDGLLQGLAADAVMTLDGLDGYLTALLVGPSAPLGTLPTAQWLPLVWGGDDDTSPDGATPFASKRQRKNTVVMVLRHLRHLHQVLTESPDGWQPIFSVAEQGGREWGDARDWCTGFLQAVDLLPGTWGRTWDDPVLAPLLVLGGGLAGPADHEGDLADPDALDRLSRAVPDAVLQLAARSNLPT
jgi:uncharacterized protein